MQSGRTKNTTRNIGAGLLDRLVSLVLPFAIRTAIIWTLGAEFTGLASLFASILQVLSIAELGFNTAIVYNLYKPMADGDKKKICEIVSLFKKIYRVVGAAMLIIGLVIMPFLPRMINGGYPSSINLYIVYLLYLVNSAASYFLFAYKECLLIADQRQDIAKNTRTTVKVLVYLSQLIVLLITKNFYVYLIVQIIGTILTNIIIQFITVKRYPYYKRIGSKIKMPKSLKKQVSGLMINKICDTCRNSFDSIIISAFIGLTATAIYGNYYYIYAGLYGIMLAICNAMGASIGNSIVKKDEDKNFKDMLVFTQIFSGLLGFCTIMLACIYQPFMEIWVGKDLMLPTADMLLFCVYFYAINLNNIRNQYISGTGMWWKLKASYIVEAVANLALNIALGKLFGITGVVMATIITIFLFNYLQRNRILFKNYFSNQRISKFYKEQFYYFMLTMIGFAISYSLCLVLPQQNNVIEIIIRVAICMTIPNIIYYLGVRFTKRFKETKTLLVRVKRIILLKNKT